MERAEGRERMGPRGCKEGKDKTSVLFPLITDNSGVAHYNTQHTHNQNLQSDWC